MKKKDFLQVGENVKLHLSNGEDFEGKIICRRGIGDADNFVPSNEIIKVKNDDYELEVSFSNIKDAVKI